MFANEEPKTLLKKVTSNRGKFIYKNKIYYYSTDKNDNIKKIAITGNSYINTMKKEILRIILVEVGITFIIVSLVVIIWSNSLVNRIKKLKDKKYRDESNEYIVEGVKLIEEAVKENAKIKKTQRALENNANIKAKRKK